MQADAAEPPPALDVPHLAAPDWSAVTGPVPCPLCDYDLRGLAEPRCPECGYRFEWPDLLDPTRRRHKFLFEHHRGRNAWSFLRTLTATLQPRRFWRSLHPAQPSVPRRLAEYGVIVLALASLAPATYLVHAFAVARFGLPSKTLFWLGFINDTRQAMEAAWRFSGVRQLLQAMACYLLWAASTLGALLVFRISMRRARIRPDHVARCVVYSFDAVLWTAAAVVIAEVAGFFVDLYGGSDVLEFVMVNAVPLACLLLVPSVPYRLWMAYRLYLRFDRPLLTVLASQAIALLVLINAYLLVMTWGVS